MDNPAKYQKSIEHKAYSSIKELTGENFENVKWWIGQLVSLHYSMGMYDGKTQLKKEITRFMNDDK